MATLHVRDMDERLYNSLKTSARLKKRSVSQEAVAIIQEHLRSGGAANATLEFLALSGAWRDERTAAEIVDEIRKGRAQSGRFGADNGLFD